MNRNYLSPLQALEIKLPNVVEFVVIIVFSSENVHAVTVLRVESDASRVANSRAWNFITCWVNLLPSFSLESEYEHIVGPLSEFEPTENNHTVVIVTFENAA